MEKPLFFQDKNGKKLFGILYEPNFHKNNVGSIFCQPIAEERSRTRRLFVNWARFLCSRGYPCLIFDYFGEGDSEGDFGQANVDTRVNDILSAIKFLKEEQKYKQVGLIGLRLGATLVALASKLEKNINFLVLCQPVIKGNDYIQDWLKINLVSQFTSFKKINSNRQQLINEIMKNGFIEVEGYTFGKGLYEQLEQINLMNNNFSNVIDTLLVEFIDKHSRNENTFGDYFSFSTNQRINYLKLTKSFDWKSYKNYNQNQVELYESCLNWIMKLG